MARERATAASTESTLYNNQDQKYFTNREISGLCMNPSWQCSLAFSSAGHAGIEGSTEGQLGSPSPGNRVGPRQQCLLQVGTIPSAQAPSARDRAHLHLALPVESPCPPCQTLGLCRKQLWREPCLQLHKALHHLPPSAG